MTIKPTRKLALAIGTLGLSATLATGCGDGSNPSSEAKIYGGTKTVNGEWLSAVAIADSYLGVYCSGTAITPRVIITAAHCIPGNVSRTSIYVGNGISGGSFRGQFKVIKAEASPRYGMSFNGANDVGYMVLEKPMPLPASAFVPVLTDKDEIAQLLKVGNGARIIGFGGRSDGGTGEKYQVDTFITSLFGTEVAIGGGGKDSCQGDSGGPAYTQLPSGEWRVFGIVSRGGSCGRGGIYGVMSSSICWVQSAAGLDLGLPTGTCPALPAPVASAESPSPVLAPLTAETTPVASPSSASVEDALN